MALDKNILQFLDINPKNLARMELQMEKKILDQINHLPTLPLYSFELGGIDRYENFGTTIVWNYKNQPLRVRYSCTFLNQDDLNHSLYKIENARYD